MARAVVSSALVLLAATGCGGEPRGGEARSSSSLESEGVLVLTAQTGDRLLAHAGVEEAAEPLVTCGVAFRYRQPIKLMSEPCGQSGPGGCAQSPALTWTTGVLPPGVHAVEFATYCSSPHSVYRVR